MPDVAAIKYNSVLHRFEFTSLVWDIGSQSFATTFVDTNGNSIQDANEKAIYQQQYLFYQSRGVENTQIATRGGDDVFHADPEFNISKDQSSESDIPDFGGSGSWGINEGAFEQAAGTQAELNIRGGAGDDALYGGWYNDVIEGGDGSDYLVGSFGDDQIDGGGGADRLFGNEPKPKDSQNPYEDFLPWNGKRENSIRGISELFTFDIASPFAEFVTPKLQGVALNKSFGCCFSATPRAGSKAAISAIRFKTSFQYLRPPVLTSMSSKLRKPFSAIMNNFSVPRLHLSSSPREHCFIDQHFKSPIPPQPALRISMSYEKNAAVFINGVEVARHRWRCQRGSVLPGIHATTQWNCFRCAEIR